MRKLALILISWICIGTARTQFLNADSLRNLLSKSKSDTDALWDLAPRTSLSLDMNYFHSEPSSKNTAYASQSSGNGTKFPVAGINLMAGRELDFKRNLSILTIPETANRTDEFFSFQTNTIKMVWGIQGV
jgi:hypothetical protein